MKAAKGVNAREVANRRMVPTGVAVAGDHVDWTSYAPESRGGGVKRVRKH